MLNTDSIKKATLLPGVTFFERAVHHMREDTSDLSTEYPNICNLLDAILYLIPPLRSEIERIKENEQSV